VIYSIIGIEEPPCPTLSEWFQGDDKASAIGAVNPLMGSSPDRKLGVIAERPLKTELNELILAGIAGMLVPAHDGIILFHHPLE
jgi:hypothetical protein